MFLRLSPSALTFQWLRNGTLSLHIALNCQLFHPITIRAKLTIVTSAAFPHDYADPIDDPNLLFLYLTFG